MQIDKRTIRKIFVVAAGCILLYWLLHETERFQSFWKTTTGIISPFVIGAALAFIFNVPMRAIERNLRFIKRDGLRRMAAILLTFVAIVLVIAGVVGLLVPQITETVQALAPKLVSFFQNLQQKLWDFLEDNPEVREWLSSTFNANFDMASFDWANLIQKAMTMVTNSVSAIATGAFTAVGSIAGGLVDAVIGLVFALYCLASKETLARQGRHLIYALLPERVCDETVRILRLTNSTFSNFISGQCVEAIILGCLFAVAMAIFHMPYIPLVSVLIAVTALVPLVGAFIGCFLGAFFILVNDPVQAVGFVVMFLVLQQIEGNLIYPKVVGTSIGLPGMWVLVAVTVGGDLMGVAGMFLMIPAASVLYALTREFTRKRLEERGIDPEKLKAQPPELKSASKKKLDGSKIRAFLQKVKEKAAAAVHPKEEDEQDGTDESE